MGKTIGRRHHERCSIPQGCPFSMALVALITRAWINKMEHIHVEPRCLADDLFFTSSGSAHRARCIHAMKESKVFFNDVGAKVASNKCFLFSTCNMTREFLSNFEWDEHKLRIPVVSNFRYLGAHLNLTTTSNGSTFTNRILKAASMAKHEIGRAHV